jgi:tripartite-type tricarboxylate transporter receptor subunit TctC
MRYARVIASLLIAGWALLPTTAPAQTYPNKPITLICPFPPGGATDAISRIIQEAMSQSLGQAARHRERRRAGGMIAAAKAARAAPDGYTS